MSLDATIADTFAVPETAPGEAVDEREARRMDRLGELEALRRRAGRISARLCDRIEGNLPHDEDDPLARLADPVLAFTRVATAIRRIVALEEQLDEDAESRELRLGEELEKRVVAMEADEKARDDAEIKRVVRANRNLMRKTVLDDIGERDGDMSRARRELLLNDLLADLDDVDYVNDPDAAIERIREEFDAILGPPPEPDDTEPDDPDDEFLTPKPRKKWAPATSSELTALMLQSTDLMRRKLTRMADG